MEHEKKEVDVTFEDGSRGKMELLYPVKTKDRVYICGCAPTKNIIPFDDENAEFWGVNNLYGVPLKGAHYDRWFEIHNIWQDSSGKLLRRGSDEFRGQKVLEYLQGMAEIGCTVYMQKHWSNLVPMSVPYPLNDIIQYFHEEVGLGIDLCRYLTNTITYEIVLAIYLGFKEIYVYGVDMSAGSEYEAQRPSCEFWMGVAAGMGIKVFVPAEADLLKCRFIYGFEEVQQNHFKDKMERLRVDTKLKRLDVERQMEQGRDMVNQYKGCEKALEEVGKIWANLEDDLVVTKRGTI